MNEQYVRDNFIGTFNTYADDIFAYCYKKTAHRDIARYLTRAIFMETWDEIAAGHRIYVGKADLMKTARQEVARFLTTKDHQVAISENLWSLTLSQ